MSKSTNAEIEQRVNKVYEWLIINRWNRRDILEYIRKNTEWNVERAQVDNYIAEANKRLEEKNLDNQDKYYKKSAEQFDDMYKKAMSQKDVRLCKDIKLAECKCMGWDRIHIDHSGRMEIDYDKIGKKLNELLGESESDNTDK